MTTVIQPLDFWNLFVVNVFGGFWPAVIGLMILYFFILILGRVSMYSSLWFMLLFLTCMAMGYGYGLVTILITLFILVRFMFDVALLVRGKQGL